MDIVTSQATLPLSRESITTLVHAFYADVRSDADLGPVFDNAIGDHWDAHLDRMVEFWSTVIMRTHSFQGNVFGKHMALQGITPEHFTRWMALWTFHTDRLFSKDMAAEFQTTAAGIGRMLHHGFFNQFPDGSRMRKHTFTEVSRREA